ncbi:MAG: hypothetical protein JW746_10665 [Candidatus Krumholzibacteriota bacterium]|nr:hypothetical protein [Candidatus Krumholzibacteriota bacterium]
MNNAVILFLILLIPVCGNAFELFISPEGNDDDPGTYSRPIMTLQKANDLLEENAPDEDVLIYIISDQGRCGIENTTWTYSSRKHRTTITSYPENSMASFSASGYKGNAFITFKLEKGEPTNIHIEKIKVEDCPCRVFLFKGDPEDPSGWNGYNSISNCTFENVGNYRYPDKHIAYSVIGFVNTRHSEVHDCKFINIKNHTAATYPQKRISLENRKDRQYYPNILEYEASNKRAGGHNPNLPVIGIYFAHNCDSNQVSGNTFINVKGDVVRIRDNTTNLIFSCNKTVLSGWSAIITAWHGEKEMPSKNVMVTDNEFIGNWLYGMPAVFKDLTDSTNKNIVDQSVLIENNETREHRRIH